DLHDHAAVRTPRRRMPEVNQKPSEDASASLADPTADAYHMPVLLAECLEMLQPGPGKAMLDATLGGGGHSAALAQALQPGGTLIGLDRDPEALTAARIRLDAQQPDCTIILFQTPFGKLEPALEGDSRTRDLRLDGILFDMGVSSHQLDTKRGFSF